MVNGEFESEEEVQEYLMAWLGWRNTTAFEWRF